MAKQKKAEFDLAAKNFKEAERYIHAHPMFAPMANRARIVRVEGNLCPEEGWAVVTKNGMIHVHPKRRGEVAEWVYILAHSLLHLGFGHFKEEKENPVLWNIACDCAVAKFLSDMKLGRPPLGFGGTEGITIKSEEEMYQKFLDSGVPESLKHFGTAGDNTRDIIYDKEKLSWYYKDIDWEELFGRGLSEAVTKAVQAVAGYSDFLTGDSEMTPAQKARNWFINHYPLLGSLAAGFDIIEDQTICSRNDIHIAAIDVTSREIFINSSAGLSEEECRFVMAHELLHAGLMHHERCQGRDHYYWNVACDFVINQWLVEMGIGELPKIGVMYDPELKGMSAEAIYDRMMADIRTYRKLFTLRGLDKGDIIDRGDPKFWEGTDSTSLDDFCKSALMQGLVYHEEQARGFLPRGIVEEIKALGHPPLKWDVELAKWFDGFFEPLEKTRTYARVSRRQSSTPDIPRPKWVHSIEAEDGRTFGVLIDTSGSMDKKLLAKALGAIASYSISRDVPFVRVIFCDAAAYDEGYMSPEDISDRVKVKGRGGTVLQPGIDLLQKAEDFPKDGPLLIITDAECDRLFIKREHAFLIPKGKSLPFIPKGPVFRMD